MSELKRRKNESFEAFMRRTKKGWKMSGKILQAKKIKFFTSAKSKNVRRKAAVKKSQKVSKQTYLIKTGKLPEPEPRFGRRR